jgi:hypothetical protein
MAGQTPSFHHLLQFFPFTLHPAPDHILGASVFGPPCPSVSVSMLPLLSLLQDKPTRSLRSPRPLCAACPTHMFIMTYIRVHYTCCTMLGPAMRFSARFRPYVVSSSVPAPPFPHKLLLVLRATCPQHHTFIHSVLFINPEHYRKI